MSRVESQYTVTAQPSDRTLFKQLNWRLKFFAVFNFIGLVCCLLGGIILIALSFMPESKPQLWGFAVIALTMSGFYWWIGTTMWKSASAFYSFADSDFVDAEQFGIAFRNFRSFILGTVLMFVANFFINIAVGVMDASMKSGVGP